MKWINNRAWTIACVWNVKNNQPKIYISGQYKEFEDDLYSMLGDYQEEIIDKAREYYYKRIVG